KVLEEDGRFEVRIANNGFDAGMMVKEYRPDLIVLDVMLPDINGKEVCQRVRADATLEDVHILCISGMIEEDKIQELKLAGADDFLHKPFVIDELIDRMCAQLEIELASGTAALVALARCGSAEVWPRVRTDPGAVLLLAPFLSNEFPDVPSAVLGTALRRVSVGAAFVNWARPDVAPVYRAAISFARL